MTDTVQAPRRARPVHEPLRLLHRADQLLGDRATLRRLRVLLLVARNDPDGVDCVTLEREAPMTSGALSVTLYGLGYGTKRGGEPGLKLVAWPHSSRVARLTPKGRRAVAWLLQS